MRVRRLFLATNTILSVLPVWANFTWAQARVCLGVATPLVPSTVCSFSTWRKGLVRERKIHKDPAGNWTRNSITSSTLLPLSHWTHSRGAEASLLITTMLEASADSSCLSLCYHRYTVLVMNGDPQQMGLWVWVDWLYKQLAWANTLTPQPLAQLSPGVHKGI